MREDDLVGALELFTTRQILGADDRARTGDLDLGKVALYQLSYVRVKTNISGLSRAVQPLGRRGARDESPRLVVEVVTQGRQVGHLLGAPE